MQKVSDFIKKHILLLSLIYAGGLFALNFVRIFDQNFWYDESFSLGLVAKSLPEVISGTALDVHPPFYYVILWLAVKLFGYTPIVFRAVSLLPLVLILILSFTWVRKKFSIYVTLLLVTFSCALETAMLYNVEVRMYSWGALLMFLTFIAFYEILYKDKTAYYVMFSVVSLCAAYNHYYTLIGVAFFYLALLVLAFTKKEVSLKKVLILCGVAVALYLPWLFVLFKTFGRTSGDYWITRVSFFEESLAFIYTDAGSGNPFGYVLAAVLFPLTIGYMLHKFNLLFLKENNKGKKRLVLSTEYAKYSKEGIWFLSGLVCIYGTILVGTLVSILFRPMYITRYIFPMAVIAWLMAGIAVSKLRMKKLVTALLIFAVLAVNIPIYAVNITAERKEHQRFIETKNATADIIGEGDVIFIENGHLALTVEGVFDGMMTYYYPGSLNSWVQPDGETDEEQYKLTNVLTRFGKPQNGSEYYLFLQDAMSDRFTGLLTENGYAWEEIFLYGNVGTYNVYIYRLIPVN